MGETMVGNRGVSVMAGESGDRGGGNSDLGVNWCDMVGGVARSENVGRISMASVKHWSSMVGVVSNDRGGKTVAISWRMCDSVGISWRMRDSVGIWSGESSV